jgi:hypothetical protein
MPIKELLVLYIGTLKKITGTSPSAANISIATDLW